MEKMQMRTRIPQVILMVVKRHKIMGLGIIMIFILTALASTRNETDQFNIRFFTWGSLPFKKSIIEDVTHQKILFAIRKEAKSYSEIAREIAVSVDTIKESIVLLSKSDLVVALEPSSDRWISNIPIYDENEILLAENICGKYAKREADIFSDSLQDIQELYGSFAISGYFDWPGMSWIIIGALISDLVVIDRIRFFPEYRDEQLLPQVHPDGSRWSLSGYVNFDGIEFKERVWSFYQAFVKDEKAGFSTFGYYKPKENRQKPPQHPLNLAIQEEGDILFNIYKEALSFEDILRITGIPQDALRKKIEYLSSLDPPAIMKINGKYASNIPIFMKSDFERLLTMADKIAAKIHSDVIVPCNIELTNRAKEINLIHPFPDGALVRDLALKLLVDEGVLPELPRPPVPWNFGVWGWEGQLLLWEEVTN